jgi:outer membrane protein assembly factor BamB
MKKQMTNLKITVALVIFGLCLVQNCIRQEEFLPPYVPEDQCVTPIKEITMRVSSNGISVTPDGTFFGVAAGFGIIHLLNNQGEIIWTRDGIGSRYALLSDNKTMLVESYNKEEPWKSTIIKLDIEGNILWERQTGLIGVDGLAVTPDGSYIAVGATDEEKNGHLMLFDGDGTKLWNHQIDGRVETVAVSKTGYVVAGPRDRCIYVYDSTGDLIFNHYAGNFYDTQDTVIAPDESYFLFGSEHKYLNCHTLEGDLLWQEEVGAPCNIRISADGEYIVVATDESTLFLFEKNGTKLWSKKATDAFFIEEVAVSAHAEYIAITAKEKHFLSQLYITVYNRQGELLWRYEGSQPFKAIAISDDGHYIAAGNSNALVFFDNFAAIEEYKSSECAQSYKDEQFKVCIC